MRKEQPPQKSMTRRQFVQQGTIAVAGLLLASCADDTPAPEATATLEVAQVAASATSSPPTAAPPTASPPTTTSSAMDAATQASAAVPPTSLPPTPQCADDDDETPAQTEGPFYTPDTPQRTSLREDGAAGVPLVLVGQVLSTGCQPLANAILDFWHADDGGQYDNQGYRYRGHQFTDDQGRFRLETIMPGLYPGRTRHIHVKVQGQDTPLLTTQLYFPGEPGNASDGIFDEALLVDMQEADGAQAATFNFVLESV